MVRDVALHVRGDLDSGVSNHAGQFTFEPGEQEENIAHLIS